ncbi:TATA element modulatory factor 1 TATA binding-domain-containing protein [Kalaharituber pfeilii]|nr:TATA element modulatory factor 1 TATA binding-domain-containing protein [Kalaharituber pfeilii]
MQERLAAAMARSASPSLRAGSPAQAGSAIASSRSSMDAGRGSFDRSRIAAGKDKDKEKEKEQEEQSQAKEDKQTKVEGKEDTAQKGDVLVEQAKFEIIPPPQPSLLPTQSTPEPNSKSLSDLTSSHTDGANESMQANATEANVNPSKSIETVEITVGHSKNASGAHAGTKISADYEAIIAQLRNDLITCEVRRQEESHAASERIDALENKIKYLARESADAAKRRATASPAGGLEKQLAEKEERIALLLEEGERLSKLELNHMTIIKKLRGKITEDEKSLSEIKRKLERAEKEAAEGKEKLKKAGETEKRLNERVKALSKLESDVEGLRKEKVEKDALVADLKAQLSMALAKAKESESRAQSEALDAEKKLSRDLREQLEKLQTEAGLVEEKLQSEISDLKAKMERNAERAKMTESELRSELSLMETKMEVIRARAEEVSSGAAGDAHAKLLRQVETLQTQYAIASENWQGIEGSLLARVSAVEKERDELAKTEADVRRKARDFKLKAKRAEMDLETANAKIKDLEDDIESFKQREERLQKKAADLDSALTEAKLVQERAKEEFDRELSQMLEDNRLRKEETASSLMCSTSPPLPRFSARSAGRSPNQGADGNASFSSPTRRDTSASGSFIGVAEEAGQPRGARPSFSNPVRQDSNLPLPQFQHPLHSNSSRASLQIGNSAASVVDDDEDYFINNSVNTNQASGGQNAIIGPAGAGSAFYPPSSHSPPARNFSHTGPQDLVSVSTVAAGPSVQLVERMSATVRRLETEMAANREELARMVNQRDEARQEIVELMREVEAKREAEEKVRKLQEEKDELDRRFHAALDELGEKLDKVDELEDQMADLKMMYKDLVLRTSGKG